MEFETLINKISPTLKRITYKLNGHYTAFNHEDLYQEALIHLWEDFTAGKLGDKTDSYILQGCYFHLKNHIRKVRVKYAQISLDAMADESEDGRYSVETAALEQLHIKPHRECVHDKLLVDTIMNNGFTLREKKLLLCYADGLTTRAIGSTLGISHVMVIKMMNKIREKCRKYVDFD